MAACKKFMNCYRSKYDIVVVLRCALLTKHNRRLINCSCSTAQQTRSSSLLFSGVSATQAEDIVWMGSGTASGHH